MVNEKEERAAKPSTSIPPPCDPFPTYQTPYPRSPQDEENPFIQFRRFADQQLSSLFNGFPSLFGLAGTDSWMKDFEDMAKRTREFEEGWKKQMEQEMEEMKRAFDRERRTQELVPEHPHPWWSRGRASKCPALNESQHHNLGSLPSTELDVYESGEKKETTGTETQKYGWFSSLGWDGRQMQRGGESTAQPGRPVPPPKKYPHEVARYLDPFSNTEETIPWLLLSPYSPVYLCNPSQRQLLRVRIQDAPGTPFQVSSTWFGRRAKPQPFDEKMAQELPWADAFEDLISIEQTGKMIDRDYSTYRTPNTWIHDMVSRGSLGPRWDFNEEGLLVKRYTDESSEQEWFPSRVSGRFRRRDACSNRKPERVIEHPVKSDEPLTASNDKVDDTDIWPSPQGVLSAIQESEKLAEDFARSIEDAVKETHNSEIETGSDQDSGPQSLWSSTSASSSWSTHDSSNNKTDSLVSTLTTTETRTLPDGSVETRKVLKKRFADGREESNESVEVHNGSEVKNASILQNAIVPNTSIDKQTQTSPTPVQDQLRQKGRSGGWFWN